MLYEIISRKSIEVKGEKEVFIEVIDTTSLIPTLALIDMRYDSENKLRFIYVNFESNGVWYLRALKFGYEYQREDVEFIKELKPHLLSFIYWQFEDDIDIDDRKKIQGCWE